MPAGRARLTIARIKDIMLARLLASRSMPSHYLSSSIDTMTNRVLTFSTVLAETGAQLYARSYIEGATDFIFGQEAEAWFDQCDIRVASASLGYITASGRASDDSSYYVINNSTIAAADGADVPSGSFYLGRPWEDYARVAFQDTDLSDIINSAGWSIWNTGDERTDHVSFGEYGNTGSGSEGTRASFATQLSEPVAIADILRSDYESASWVDTSYIG